MKKLILLLSYLAYSTFIFGQQAADPERDKGWQSDIDTLLVLMKQHYIYKSKPLPPALIAKATQLKENVSQYSDERVGFELEKLMYYMHDGHSYMLPIAVKRPPNYWLPIQFYIFADGVYIIGANESNSKLIGKKVLFINGIKVEKLIEDMQSYVHQDNRYTVIWFAPTILRFRALYEMYGLPKLSSDITLELADKSNGHFSEKISFIPATDFKGIPKLAPSPMVGAPPPPLYLTNVSTNFWIKWIPERSTLYFQFNQVQDMETETLAQFSKKLDSALSVSKPRLLIIDVRHNNGGNGGLLPPLINTVKKYTWDQKDAHIIVITGRNTFSAAQIFISLINKFQGIKYAGEPSSSSPNFVGEEGFPIMLPWSGAIGNISTVYHENIPGDKRKWIQPEYYITLSSADYFENRDPVMEWISKNYKN